MRDITEHMERAFFVWANKLDDLQSAYDEYKRIDQLEREKAELYGFALHLCDLVEKVNLSKSINYRAQLEAIAGGGK